MVLKVHNEEMFERKSNLCPTYQIPLISQYGGFVINSRRHDSFKRDLNIKSNKNLLDAC